MALNSHLAVLQSSFSNGNNGRHSVTIDTVSSIFICLGVRTLEFQQTTSTFCVESKTRNVSRVTAVDVKRTLLLACK